MQNTYSESCNASELLSQKVSHVYDDERATSYQLLAVIDQNNRHFVYAILDNETREMSVHYARVVCIAMHDNDTFAFVINDERCTLAEALAKVYKCMLTDDFAIH
jgi:hypothetical protein